MVTRVQADTFENTRGHLQEKRGTLTRGQDTYENTRIHVHEVRKTLMRDRRTRTGEGRSTLTREQEDTYRRAGRHLREGRRTRTGGQESTYERVGGHLREESDEKLEGEP